MDSVFKPKNTCKNARVSVPIILSKYDYEKRQGDQSIWPRQNSKKMGIKTFATHFLTSYPLVHRLRDDGILPLLTFHTSSGDSIDIPFGPQLDVMSNPIPPGSCWLSTTVYRRFGMSLHSTQNDAWRSQPESVSAIIVRSPEKNCLPRGLASNGLPEEDYQDFLDLIADNDRSNLIELEPRSPLAEMNSILTTGERFGFDIYRSGGNSSIVGAAPPCLSDFTPGIGAWLEQEQTINNGYNFSLEVVAERRTVVSAYGSGDIVPPDYRDKKLVEMNGEQSEQAFYFGCYWIFARGERQALTPSQVEDIVTTYKTAYPKLGFHNLRFLLCPHRMYGLIPVDYPHRIDGYRMLKIDSPIPVELRLKFPKICPFLLP